jgi:hypothetical protein
LGEQLFDGLATGTLAEYGDFIWIAAEFCDVGSSPLQSETLV